jgi:predicted ATPase
LAEFADREWARAGVTRLEEMRVAAREDCLSLRLDLGEDRALVAELEALVFEHPLRERPWMLLATALYRSGRPADALRRISTFRSILRDELGLDPPVAIRGLESRILESDPALLPSPQPLSGRRPQLPPGEVTPLVGRSIDLAGIVTRLGEHRLVTLVGPGGVGKTRLAMRVAADVWDARSGEVYVVELAPVHDPLLTLASIATAIDVHQRQHLSVEATLIEFLRGRRALLVLDNCEHLRAAVARLIERLLAACPDLTVLTTSREVLGLAGEHVQRVDPLAIAEAAMSVDEISNVAAVRLFVDRATASNPGFVLGPDNVEAVAEIVRRVDGLPLAIELAAARLRAISPAALAERLGQRFDLLDHAQFTPIERHQTVRDLVGWSFNLLTPDEQTLFARFSVFAGAFGLDAVESICTDDTLDASAAARLLFALVDKSMVQMTDAQAGRYRVLEPLREFGRAQLDHDERIAVSEHHATWFVNLAERSAAALAGPQEASASASLDHDFDNLRSAFSWSVEHRDLERACKLVVALHEYSFRSMRAEVIAWADDVIAVPGFDESPQAPLVLGVAAYGRFVRGDLDSSIRYGELAIAASIRIGVGTFGLAERSLGNSLFYRGDSAAAQQWIDCMLDDAREGSSARLTHALYMRSVAFTSVGNPQLGVELAEEAFITARCCGSPTALAQASYALGLALESSDDVAAAALLTQAAEVAAGAGNRWIQAFALTEVLWLEARQGSPRAALAGFSGVIDLWFRGGDWANQWLSLRHVFGILVQLHDHRGAATLHGALTAVGAAYALPFEASDAGHITELVGMLRDRLGAADFAAVIRHGASMSDGEIVDFIQERIAALAR